MPDELATVGERLVGRPLQVERRAGTPHFVTGQHHAEIYEGLHDAESGGDIELARLSYVDVGGHAVVVLLVRDKGTADWTATWLGRAGHAYQAPATRAPGSFALSEKMQAALADAEKRGRVPMPPDTLGAP